MYVQTVFILITGVLLHLPTNKLLLGMVFILYMLHSPHYSLLTRRALGKMWNDKLKILYIFEPLTICKEVRYFFHQMYFWY